MEPAFLKIFAGAGYVEGIMISVDLAKHGANEIAK